MKIAINFIIILLKKCIEKDSVKMIAPVRFCGNYSKNEEVIKIPSWVNEPYRKQRQQRLQTQLKEDEFVQNSKAQKHSKNVSKNIFSMQQLAAIGAATLAMAGMVVVPSAVKNSSKEQNEPASSVVVEVPTPIAEPQIEEIPIETVEEKYNIPDFEINLTDEQKASLDSFLQNWAENKDIYEQVASKTNVPAELVAAIHWRESGGNFNAYLHNGTKIGEALDTINGPKVFYSWQDSALDALTNYGGNPDNIIQDDFQSYCDYAEHYNGMGYSKYHDMNSPYVWAGTNLYTSGKYVQDGSFDPNTVDRQLGVAVMLKTLLENNG